ncbi:hypothetical protein [Pannonibacter tanglangensis]|uniref:Uncharacterized protein n=1 Tax=Pannonibacter tanglangensis TaxID=2750084 RepID=A0ABW9ZFX8_9HYPH|nr:hypothetical protein [Pannonibacter sp. XCT-34]NBN62084.1 hypothetical protein [Pannonibacter sp. XCT-34]
MIKIEMTFPDFAAAADAMLRIAGSPPATLEGEGRTQVWARMLPGDAAPAATPDAAPEIPLSPNTRLIGEAGSGGRRRTKAEIAEDDELTELGAGFGMTVAALNNAILTQGRVAVRSDLARSGEALPLANISTAPEDRRDPENPEPAGEADATDAAEPAADTPDQPGDDTVVPPTADDVRRVVKAALLQLSQADVAKIFFDIGGAPNVAKMAPSKYAAVINAMTAAMNAAGAK